MGLGNRSLSSAIWAWFPLSLPKPIHSVRIAFRSSRDDADGVRPAGGRSDDPRCRDGMAGHNGFSPTPGQGAAVQRSTVRSSVFARLRNLLRGALAVLRL